MTAQQRQYTSDGEALAASALAVEDFEEASNALRALKKEHNQIASDVALKILRGHIGDVFYRAFAFEILYSVALNDAVAYIESDAGTESPYVLGAMIESVTEDAGVLTSRDEIQKAVLLLRKALALRSREVTSSLVSHIARFEDAYRSW